MTFASAYKDYWLSFGLPVYDENTVPDTAQMPYITYQYNENGFDDGEVYLGVSLWYKGFSWFEVDLKADGGLMQMMGSFTVLRLTSMMGMMNISFTKEELLKMNKKLNRIKKPKN